MCVCVCVCECVCVCVRERERGGGERETQTDRQTDGSKGGLLMNSFSGLLVVTQQPAAKNRTSMCIMQQMGQTSVYTVPLQTGLFWLSTKCCRNDKISTCIVKQTGQKAGLFINSFSGMLVVNRTACCRKIKNSTSVVWNK